MKAAVQTAYGPPDVVVIRDMAKPVPKANEVLVRIVATTVTSGDARLRAFRVPPAFWLPARLFLGIRKPRRSVLGSEFAGIVEAVGPEARRFRIGDRVFGMHVYDVHAEYKVAPETGAITTIPDNLDLAEAAALPFGALTALHFLERAGIGPGQRVLINGASGAVGTFAVQLARHRGAHVTAVTSARNLDLVRGLGADVAAGADATAVSGVGSVGDTASSHGFARNTRRRLGSIGRTKRPSASAAVFTSTPHTYAAATAASRSRSDPAPASTGSA